MFTSSFRIIAGVAITAVLCACAPPTNNSFDDTGADDAGHSSEYAARATAHGIRSMLSFLWNRDFIGGGREKNRSGPCLLSGDYQASGTEEMSGDCATGFSQSTVRLSYDLTSCSHTIDFYDGQLTYDGRIDVRRQSSFSAGCERATSETTTYTGEGIDVTASMLDLEDCDIELNYSLDQNGGSLAGTVCGTPVEIVYE